MENHDEPFWRLHVYGAGPEAARLDTCCAGKNLTDAASWAAAAARSARSRKRDERYVLVSPHGREWRLTMQEAADFDRAQQDDASLPLQPADVARTG